MTWVFVTSAYWVLYGPNNEEQGFVRRNVLGEWIAYCYNECLGAYTTLERAQRLVEEEVS